jgi:hypothetical protein
MNCEAKFSCLANNLGGSNFMNFFVAISCKNYDVLRKLHNTVYFSGPKVYEDVTKKFDVAH